MAQKTTVTVIDDIDGSEDAKTVRFAVENGQYEIDLSDENVDKLYQALDPFLAHARKLGGRTTRTPSSTSKQNLAAVREWAQLNGHKISGRGRIPQSVLDAYNAR